MSAHALSSVTNAALADNLRRLNRLDYVRVKIANTRAQSELIQAYVEEAAKRLEMREEGKRS